LVPCPATNAYTLTAIGSLEAAITAGVDLGIAIAWKWAGENMGRVIELITEYAPQPPYRTGRPDLADAQTFAAAQAALQRAMTGIPGED
jgi:hypothetical protein